MAPDGMTITAETAAEARAKLAEAMRGHQIPEVTVIVWRENESPYFLHIGWKILATLLTESAMALEEMAL